MKTVIEMAQEAGWKDLRDYDSQMRHDFFMGNTDSLARLVELTRADEREACAKICDVFQARDVGMQPAECAGAIRARSKNT